MEYIPVLLTVIYFILGFGVWSMWRRGVDDGGAILVIFMWPLVLLITCFKVIEK